MKKNTLFLGLAVSALLLSACNGGGNSKHINYDSNSEFEITETSAKELSEKLTNIGEASLKSIDNFGIEVKGKDISVDFTNVSKEVAEPENTESESVEQTSEEAVILTETNSLKLTGGKFNLQLGMHGLKSATKADELLGYVELKDVGGSLSYTKVDANNKETKAAYSLVNNTFQIYQAKGNEYVHLSKDLVNTVFGLASKAVPEDNAAYIAVAKAMIPDNGKMCFTGLTSTMKFPLIKDKTAESETSESESEVETVDFVNTLLELKKTANDNGYLVEQLMTIKVSSDKNHYLGLYLSINADQLKNVRDLSKKLDKEIELPLDIDVYNASFEKMEVTLEADAQMRVNYANFNVDKLNYVDEDELDEYSTSASSTYVKDSEIQLEATVNYDENVTKRIPSEKELAIYEEKTYNVVDLLKALMK